MSLFILHEHSKVCSGCKRIQSWTALYEPRVEGAATKLVPWNDPLPQDAIITKSLIREKDVPVCWECVPSDDSYRRKAQEAATAWAETIRRKRGEALLPSETSRFQTSKGRAPREARPIEDLA